MFRAAEENGVQFKFEASVGGGIPIIRPLHTSFTAEKIESITGILNGTTNYMLTKMDEENCDYDEVLKEAQAKGYAEQNPEADVCGYDACRKIAILASLAYEKQVDFEDIYTEGITKITTQDFDYMKKISELNDCNTCAAKKDCLYAPKPGQMARINCFSWVGKEKD